MLTGEGWKYVEDTETLSHFWYNEDTGEASNHIPKIVESRQAIEQALKHGYSLLPKKTLLKIMEYLNPSPERIAASEVCKNWYAAACDSSFFLRVLPIESGIRTNKTSDQHLREHEYSSISAAVRAARRGDTIVLGTGHHWDKSVEIDKPLRLFSSDGDDPSRCIIEVLDGVRIHCNFGKVMFCGVTIRSLRRNGQSSTSPTLTVMNGSFVEV